MLTPLPSPIPSPQSYLMSEGSLVRRLWRLQQEGEIPLFPASPWGLSSALELTKLCLSLNVILDDLYYDCSVLTRDDLKIIAKFPAHEGGLIIIRNNKVLYYTEHYHKTNDNHLLCKEHKDDRLILVVPGVGSSAFGAAALGKNVSAAYPDHTIVAVVAGQGLIDLPQEALGGFYLFSPVIHWLTGQPAPGKMTLTDELASHVFSLPRHIIRASRDVVAVSELLQEFQFCLAVGHSKGNMVIAFAIDDAVRQEITFKHPCMVVSISAMVKISDDIPVYYIIGKDDSLGWLNSDPDLIADKICQKSKHTTNTLLPDALNVRQELISAQNPKKIPS